MKAKAVLPVSVPCHEEETAFSHWPTWLLDYRQQHRAAWHQHGMPGRKHERWKYADLSFLTTSSYHAAKGPDVNQVQHLIQQYRMQQDDGILLVCVDGYFMPALSDLDKLPDSVVAASMEKALCQYENRIKTAWPGNIAANQYPFFSLNAANFKNGLFLYLPDGCELQSPVHLLSLAVGKSFAAHPNHLIMLGQKSKLTLLQEQISPADHAYLMNRVTTMHVGKMANLYAYNIQKESRQAVHLNHTFVYQEEDSNTSFARFSYGSQFARDELVVHLQGMRANCHANGFYRLHQNHQYLDHHVEMLHLAESSRSEMLYKGIVDKKARAVFNGRLYVEKDAKKIRAFQANHNLLLSNQAEAYSKPELEIYADDVKCNHGATIGQLDEQALFYLRSRGIERKTAVNILLQAFAEDVMQRVTHAGISKRIRAAE